MDTAEEGPFGTSADEAVDTFGAEPFLRSDGSSHFAAGAICRSVCEPSLQIAGDSLAAWNLLELFDRFF